MRKPTTLPPSQSQHVSHAAKKTLPLREPGDEKAIQAQFWSTSGYEKPKVKVNGIKAQDWATAQPDPESEPASTISRPLSPIDPNPPRLPAAARMSFFDDTIFNEVKETPFKPEDEGRALQQYRQASRDPKRFSTMVARNSLMFPEEPILQTPDTFSNRNPLESRGMDQLHVSRDDPEVNSQSPRTFDAMKEDNEKAVGLQHHDVVYSSKRPSIPVPEQKPTAKSSESSLGSTSENSSSMTQLDLPVERTVASDSISPSRLSGPTCKSPALSFSNNVRESTVFADSAWEDDIDFVYEQEAEATCDFDWDFTGRSHANSFQSDGGVRLSQSSYGTRASSVYSGDARDGNRESRVLSDGPRNGRVLNSGATIAERREAQQAAEHARGSSVGHRGFAAARNSNGDNLAKGGKLPPLNIPARSSQGDALSPVCSITDSDDETPKSPLTPSKLEFPMPPGSSGPLRFPLPPASPDLPEFPMPPSGNRTSDSTSSDLESWRNGSKHRKSSSYGSFEDFKRASTAPSTAPSSVPSSRDTGRWSMASAGSTPSVPSLINSRHRRASSLSKAVISPPLETLTQRPDEEKLSEGEGPSVPQTLRLDPERGSFVIRRPRTSGDRRLLQAAGRAVQRYRPTTPNSSSRGVQAPEPFSGRMESSMNAPEWI